jgi:hypothetical protein
MSSSYTLQTDLIEATSMGEMLEDYVRGPDTYGYIHGSHSAPMPSLTVGALLLRLRRLQHLRTHMEKNQVAELDKLIQKWREVRESWRLHYESKLKSEAESRLEAMKSFFEECDEDMDTCKSNYPPEMLRRTIVEEILRELDALGVQTSEIRQKLTETDTRLKRLLSPDDFQWAKSLQTNYPRDEFWWLYQSPRDE